MNTKIFVNLAVKDLPKSMEFFGKLGYQFNAQFTDETAACMVISEEIYTMLLTEEKFQSFIPNTICDAKKSTEVAVCLSTESRQEVDKLVETALAAGGTSWSEPQDYGFMYFRSFQDLDGHIWEYVHMDPAHVQST
ncbi:MAG: VOC family protein [Planctomycetota bacterium]|nr:VOC family protein [Planctomycetota bacterium]